MRMIKRMIAAAALLTLSFLPTIGAAQDVRNKSTVLVVCDQIQLITVAVFTTSDIKLVELVGEILVIPKAPQATQRDMVQILGRAIQDFDPEIAVIRFENLDPSWHCA